jgi:hypothetical protein
MLVLWVSAFASAFIDNIPFVATMIPLIKGVAAMSAINVVPLWRALSLGACLGGNETLVGASANVIVAGMLQRTQHHLTFTTLYENWFSNHGAEHRRLQRLYLWLSALSKIRCEESLEPARIHGSCCSGLTTHGKPTACRTISDTSARDMHWRSRH